MNGYIDMGGTTAGGTGAGTAWSGDAALIAPEPWTTDALCAQTDPELFFPPKGGSVAAAKAVCASCDVVAECLEFALRTREPQGIWGGLTGSERARLRRAAA